MTATGMTDDSNWKMTAIVEKNQILLFFPTKMCLALRQKHIIKWFQKSNPTPTLRCSSILYIIIYIFAQNRIFLPHCTPFFQNYIFFSRSIVKMSTFYPVFPPLFPYIFVFILIFILFFPQPTNTSYYIHIYYKIENIHSCNNNNNHLGEGVVAGCAVIAEIVEDDDNGHQDSVPSWHQVEWGPTDVLRSIDIQVWWLK